MTDVEALLILLAAGFPFLGAMLAGVRGLNGHRRLVAVTSGALEFGVCLVLAAVSRTHPIPTEAPSWAGSLVPRGVAYFRPDAVFAPLLPLVSGTGLVTLLTRPRRREDDGFLRRALLTQALLVAAFTCRHPPLLALLWWGLALLPLFELRSGTGRRLLAHRVEAGHLLGGAAAFSGGVLLLAGHHGTVGTFLLVIAILSRAGVFPFQSWIASFSSRVAPGPAMSALAPQIAAYPAALLVVPHAPPWMLALIVVTSLITSLHAAALGLVQRDARRAMAWLFLSQSALVLVGLASGSAEATAGGLAVWISCGLAGTGLALALWALEARRGRLDLGRSHGGYDRMPLLATSFLLMGLALVGFPGTLGFVGQELLVDGSSGAGPGAGLVVLLAAAVNGITLLRMYFRLFCGTRAHTPAEQYLRPRERIAFTALVVALVLGGLAPRAIVDTRSPAAGPVSGSLP